MAQEILKYKIEMFSRLIGDMSRENWKGRVPNGMMMELWILEVNVDGLYQILNTILEKETVLNIEQSAFKEYKEYVKQFNFELGRIWNSALF